jgi:alkylation response protein AidB-like acyl-CoA dehydrogenase
LAYGNPSTAHCFQVHNNALMMIDAMASDDQIAKWIEPTIARGALIPGAGAEPFGAPPTTAKKVAGGYSVSGTKHYATNAGMAEWLWLGRIASDSHPKPIMLMLHKDTPGLTIDSEAWRPTGMRACVSPWLYLQDCFVPEENLLGRPGQFLDENWMGKSTRLHCQLPRRRGRCTTGRWPISATKRRQRQLSPAALRRAKIHARRRQTDSLQRRAHV